MSTIIYMTKLLAFFFVGYMLHRKFHFRWFTKVGSYIQNLTIVCLLFFMGVNTGSIDGIMDKIADMGLAALLLTVAGLAGTILFTYLVSLFFRRKKAVDVPVTVDRKGKSLLLRIFDVIKEPLMLVSIVILGMVFRLCTPLFDWFTSDIITVLLYMLLFFFGMGMADVKIAFREILTDPMVVLLPLFVIVGTYLGVMFVPLFTEYTLKECLGMASGFGWYTISGILITDLGYPMLGPVSFLCNLFRESCCFFLIPLLSRMGSRFMAPAICAAGCTSMDVTLPLITSHFGKNAMIPSIYSGLVMTLISPFLIPLFF